MRANSRESSAIRIWCCARFGAKSRAIASSAGLVSLASRLEKTRLTRSSSCPLRSRASTVSAKLGGHDAPATAAISASCSAMPRSKAGGKCPGRMRSKGGMPNGVSQVSKNGLSVMSGHRALLRNAAANVGVPTARVQCRLRESRQSRGPRMRGLRLTRVPILPAKEQCSRSLAAVPGKPAKSSSADIGRRRADRRHRCSRRRSDRHTYT